MKKRIKFKKLNRTSSHKWAMLRNMVTSLIKHERIVTTTGKAKELKYLADHVVTLAKSDCRLSGIRHANKIIREKPVLTKLFQVLGPRYEEREGGYTRILKLSKNRKGDGADMAVMEYVDRPGELRAARPPTSVQQEIMAQYLKEKIGLEPLSEDDVQILEKEINDLSVEENSDDEESTNSEPKEDEGKK
mmetsp:Transcript_13695/g.21169  ORF Transcript_13695/g.21169 Transcript_13695/m.21169 type:complete len:190 (-) Transcript_13695:3-572(-)|eukprot:CAMPEP_0194208412 /NCGR_PEP_ID=MMETSP0156-20130528/6868_1 /TAXON_ID=33649 /ORGANISM="Thalassionema nitzschioides, Strain L26-B" /LENGTH=189 /DNA_ID=CAMNT_0038935371 /DNA_START=79 /DNA_END=648 /DNA_ORIENTATION=-